MPQVVIKKILFGGEIPCDPRDGYPLQKLIPVGGTERDAVYRFRDGRVVVPPREFFVGGSAAVFDDSDPCDLPPEARRTPRSDAALRTVGLEGCALAFDRWSDTVRPPLADSDEWSRERYERAGLKIDGAVVLRIGHGGPEIASTSDHTLTLSIRAGDYGSDELWFAARVADSAYIRDLRRHQALSVSAGVYHDQVTRAYSSERGSHFTSIMRGELHEIALLEPYKPGAFSGCWVRVAG